MLISAYIHTYIHTYSHIYIHIYVHIFIDAASDEEDVKIDGHEDEYLESRDNDEGNNDDDDNNTIATSTLHENDYENENHSIPPVIESERTQHDIEKQNEEKWEDSLKQQQDKEDEEVRA